MRLVVYDLEQLTLKQMTEAGAALRRLGHGAGSMEEAAQRVVLLLRERFGGGSGDRSACVLARFYKTHPFGELEPELRDFAQELLPDAALHPGTRCMTLLATAGEREEWNSRHASARHRAIPLPSEETVERLPMIARLLAQLGVQASALVEPDPALLLDLQQHTFNVFHVPEALGSPYIPAQEEFVVPYGVRSALGFGGVLPPGELFAAILFTRVPVSRETAELFQPLALAAKLAVLPFSAGPVFAPRQK